jgi:hypothetical protein
LKIQTFNNNQSPSKKLKKLNIHISKKKFPAHPPPVPLLGGKKEKEIG